MFKYFLKHLLKQLRSEIGTVSVTIAGLRPELWRKQLMADVKDNVYMQRFIGSSEQSMIQELEDLKAQPGTNISVGLGMKLSGAGRTGDSTVEGSEEAMQDYDEDIAVDQLRNGVTMTGNMDEKKSAYDMRVSAKNRLADWLAERIDKEIIDKLCGKTSSTFANTPTAADSSHVIFSGSAGAIGSIASTSGYKFSTKVLDAAKQNALLNTPMVRPLRIGGKEYFVAILHPYCATDLRHDSDWWNSQKDANTRGEDNPIFSGALGVWNGIIVHEHEYVYTATDGSGSAVVARNILCGQQAGLIAWGSPVQWVEKSFDYGNRWGIACGAIFGTIKPVFNSKDYGVVTMYSNAYAYAT